MASNAEGGEGYEGPECVWPERWKDTEVIYMMEPVSVGVYMAASLNDRFHYQIHVDNVDQEWSRRIHPNNLLQACRNSLALSDAAFGGHVDSQNDPREHMSTVPVIHRIVKTDIGWARPIGYSRKSCYDAGLRYQQIAPLVTREVSACSTWTEGYQQQPFPIRYIENNPEKKTAKRERNRPPGFYVLHHTPGIKRKQLLMIAIAVFLTPDEVVLSLLNTNLWPMRWIHLSCRDRYKLSDTLLFLNIIYDVSQVPLACNNSVIVNWEEGLSNPVWVTYKG
jgi:hypothetical protein